MRGLTREQVAERTIGYRHMLTTQKFLRAYREESRDYSHRGVSYDMRCFSVHTALTVQRDTSCRLKHVAVVKQGSEAINT